MGNLEKAKITRIDQKGKPLGPPIVVQFNPTSLRLQLSNSNDAGRTPGRQATQYMGTGATVLTVELIFDTADEGTTDKARSVRELTLPVEGLILPQVDGKTKQAPPKVKFNWGDIIVDGFVETMTVDFDLFSQGGLPLRAKIGLTIREQDSRFELKKLGPGANGAGNATPPGQAGIGLGVSASLGASFGASASLGLSAGIGVGASLSAGVSVGAQATVAIGGESAAELAARVGVDPAAWRGIAAGQIDAPLALSAGAEVSFNAGLSASAGLGATAGVEAGAKQSIEASFGLSAGGAPAAAAGLSAPGFSLSAAGGLAAAIATVDVVRTESAAAAARGAFAAPAAPTPPAAARPQGLASVPASTAAVALAAGSSGAPARPAPPGQARAPLALTDLPSPAKQAAAATAPAPPRVDARATSFGFGVPLRPRAGGPPDDATRSLEQAIPLRPRAAVSIGATDPSAPPWAGPPVVRAARGPAGRAAPARAKRCGCTCACKHGRAAP